MRGALPLYSHWKLTAAAARRATPAMCPAPHHRLPPLTLFLITMSILCRPINMANAASEDRTHDLRIMRPTRCQLRYRRFQTWCCSLFRLYLRADSCAIMALLTIQAGHRSCGVAWPMVVFVGSRTHDWRLAEATPTHHQRGYGATAARVTPDHKVGSSNLSGLIVAMHASVPR